MNSKPYFVRTQAGGFTLIELIVAMGLSVLIAGMCTVIFNQTSLAVRTGAATSDMMGNLRTITDQMQRDARDMIGPIRAIGPTPGPPSEGGYLVIVQQNTNSNIDTTQLVDKYPAFPPGDNIADDQIAFICARGNREPMCPSNSTNFSNSSQAAYVRVWYGHALRTYPNGTHDALCALGNGATANPNRLANRWVLGRQALFLNGPDGLISNELLPGFSVWSNGVGPNSPLDKADYGPTNPATLYMGLTDVCNLSLADINAMTASGALAPIDLTYFSNRLWVNPAPVYNSGNPTYQYASWQIAQNHAAFVNNVSDFEVWYLLPGDAPGAWHRNPAGATLVYRPQDAGSWPTMIRFRWRMHDWQARIGQGNESGRWYEQIIRVKGD